MALTSLTDVLSWAFLTDTVQRVTMGVPNELPKGYFDVKKQIEGNKAEYIQLYGTRKLVGRVPYGAPAPLAGKVNIDSRRVQLVNLRSRMVFDQELMEIFRKFESYEPMKKRGLDLIVEQGRNFRQLFENTRIVSTAMYAATGVNYWDRNNNLTNTPDPLGLTISQQIPASNYGTIVDASSPGGVIINAPWSLPSTNVVTQIRNLKNLSKKLSGREVTTALYGRNVAGYIAQNESAKTYWPFQREKVEKMLDEGEIPQGFAGLKWVPVQDMFYEDSSGGKHDIFPSDGVTFQPDLTPETYTFFEGSTTVPGMFTKYADGVAAINALEDVKGMGRYAYYENQAIIDEAFDCCMPVFKIPEAWFPAIVNF